MKNLIYLCLSLFIISCTAQEEWSETYNHDIEKLSKELENISDNYELLLKEYTLEELNKVKDEMTPTTQQETDADDWLIQAIQTSLKEKESMNNGRTRVDARAYAGSIAVEGVFKYETCGNYREFIYEMDCEDGGDTYSKGNIGATRVDSYGNVIFHFCMIPAGQYYGGTLVFYQPTLPNLTGGVYVVKRHHDNEDHNNKNRIIDNAGVASTSPSYFDRNTGFFWKISTLGSPAKLPFKYGVLGNAPLPQVNRNILWIDDENGKNANQAIVWNNKGAGRDLPKDQNFYGLTPGRNTIYEIITY